MLPPWAERLPLDMIQRECQQQGLDWRLVAAICQQESGGNPDIVRFESGSAKAVSKEYFRYAALNSITPQTETVLEMTSFGLMQIMGWVVRGMGYDFLLTRLLDPSVNIHWGCLVIKTLFKRFETLDAVISAYNQGSPRKGIDGNFSNNLSYVQPVLKLIVELNAQQSDH